MIYQRRLQKSKNSGDEMPSQSLNPLIRGLRLAFILLFTAFDIGQAIYMVSFIFGFVMQAIVKFNGQIKMFGEN